MKMLVVVNDKIDGELFQKRLPKAEHAVAVEAERDMRSYIPSKRIVQSAKVTGRKIVWDGPRARLFFFGNIYVDPKFGVGGFLTPDGWRSRPGVSKVRSSRKFNFKTGGPHWTSRAKEQNLMKWREVAKEALLNGGD